MHGFKPGNIRIGALDAIAPCTTYGYLIRIQEANIPPYEPPNAITDDFSADRVSRKWRIKYTKSPRACEEERYPKCSGS